MDLVVLSTQHDESKEPLIISLTILSLMGPSAKYYKHAFGMINGKVTSPKVLVVLI